MIERSRLLSEGLLSQEEIVARYNDCNARAERAIGIRLNNHGLASALIGDFNEGVGFDTAVTA